MSQQQLDEDIGILRRETGLGQIEAESLLQEVDNDVVSAILKHQGVEPEPPKVPSTPLTEAQQKIAELREIVDEKDRKMDRLIQQSKGEGGVMKES